MTTNFIKPRQAVRRTVITLSVWVLLIGCIGKGKALGAPFTLTAPAVTFSASSLSFSTNAGTSAPSQNVTVSNSGNAPLMISAISVSGTNAAQFSQTNTCGSSLAPGANCVVTVGFGAAKAGNFTAGITLSDNASPQTQTLSLSGTETSPTVSLSSTNLTFSTPAESVSAKQTVTLRNIGNGTLWISSVGLGGPNASNFIETSTCGPKVDIGSTCTITLSLSAYLAMSYSGTLLVASNDLAGTKSATLTGTGTGTISLDTSNSANWVINNGAVTLNFNPAQFHIFSIHLNGDSNDLIDTTSLSSRDGNPLGFYMGNQGTGTGTLYTGYKQVGNQYLDFWAGEESNSSNFLTYEEHFVVTANDPGFHTYYVAKHSASDIAGSLGLMIWQFRTNLGLFTHSYEMNTGLGNLGVIDTPLPDPTSQQLADPGRQVENAVIDLHGITDSATQAFVAATGRNFYTKYDYSTYEYLHKEQGVYGSTYGVWCVLPRTDTIAGGPTKQDVDILEQLIQQEMSGGHFVGSLNYVPPQGVASTKLYGPVYYHFNEFNSTNTTPASLYTEAQTWASQFDALYNNDATLLASAYVPTTSRGAMSVQIANTGSATTNQAWTVLSDPSTNFQFTSAGYDYWANNDSTGTAIIANVVPGTYRLSSYVLGQWGELRRDGVVVNANATTTPTGLTFTPENFGTYDPIWTIGTPDRSAHEFLHGRDSNGNDFRSFAGQFSFWGDFASTLGVQTYYATAVGSTPATNDLSKINYTQWALFDPGLYAGIYNASDDTTDGYKYIVPSYVGAANVATQAVPPLTIHFTTTSAQSAQGNNVVLSLGLAGIYGNVVASLNGNQLNFTSSHNSDPMVRSGQSGYYQWLVLDWPTSYLNSPGSDNVLTLSGTSIGWMPDAMRMEITNSNGDPALTGWHDYEYVNANGYTAANDAVPNQ